MDKFISFDILILTISIATPLFIASLGGVYCERVGIVNVGLEGMILSGAFMAVVGSYYTGSAWMGVLVAVGTGALLGILHSFICIKLQAEHVISGVAINILASSMTVFLLEVLFGNKGQTPTVNQIGKIGEFSILTIIGIALVIGSHLMFKYTKIGLRLRSVGENPYAAQSLGVPVKKYMYICVIVGCSLAGLAGSYLSIGMLNVFTKNMSAGRGFIALAAVIFGRWTPLGSFGASLFFGYFMALQVSIQGLQVPSQLIEAIPYIATLVILVFTYKNTRGPAHAGQVFAFDKK